MRSIGITSLLPEWLRRRLSGPYWRVRNAVHRISYKVSRRDLRDRWKDALPGEVDFWDKFLDEEGGHVPEEFAERIDPNTPLIPAIQHRLAYPAGTQVRILDVGAGPLPSVGWKWEGHEVEVVAADPLAERYVRALQRRNLHVPARFVTCEAERLTDCFEPDSFDAVCSMNAIDHCHDPVAALRGMLALTKPGGIVYLRHFVNEGAHRAYRGLHQWNFCRDGGDLVIWNPWTRIVAADVLDRGLDCEIEEDLDRRGRPRVIVTFRKYAYQHDSLPG